MPTFLMLSGITRTERHAAISGANDAVMAGGGWVVDHTMFSNMAFALRAAVPPSGLPTFVAGLEAAGVTLDAESRAAFAPYARTTDPEAAEITVSLNITFIHDDPDLRQEVPPFG